MADPKQIAAALKFYESIKSLNPFGMPNVADIYSTIGSLKRKGADFIQNPIESAQQMVGNANDKARALNQLTAESAQEGLSFGPKTKLLASQLAEGYNPTGMTVYHGSPYKFANFDASKIGKGEGHQVYGHGLYVAENPEVAKGYAKNVKDMDSIQSLNQRAKEILKIMDEDSVYPGAYRQFKSEKGLKAAEEYDHVMAMRDQKATDKGNLYKVDLPDEHIAQMLDWDKPLHQQPKNVQEAFGKLGYIAEKEKINQYDDALLSALQGGNMNLPIQPPTLTGETLYKKLGNPVTATAKLTELGIPGIKYLDQGSRDAAEGTRNFVVFPGKENLLSIQDINGNLIK
jgi:hypothetical protein